MLLVWSGHQNWKVWTLSEAQRQKNNRFCPQELSSVCTPKKKKKRLPTTFLAFWCYLVNNSFSLVSTRQHQGWWTALKLVFELPKWKSVTFFIAMQEWDKHGVFCRRITRYPNSRVVMWCLKLFLWSIKVIFFPRNHCWSRTSVKTLLSVWPVEWKISTEGTCLWEQRTVWGDWISSSEADRGLLRAAGLLEAEFVSWCQGELLFWLSDGKTWPANC